MASPVSGHFFMHTRRLLSSFRFRAARTGSEVLRLATGDSMTGGADPPIDGSPSRRVRVTVDLAREQHRFLRRFAFEAEVDASSVLRALLGLLEEDAALAQRVLARSTRKFTA